jgi:uncharacterized protein (DUF488 family)
MERILTIGYEGSSLEDFITTLQLLKVDKLIDIREFAISRRKGFSKSALCEALATKRIHYQHEKNLGSPKLIRHRLREDNDYSRYFLDFEGYLETQIDVLRSLLSSSGTVVLMCYERDFKVCHRSVVAHKLGEISGLKPQHVGVRKQESKNANRKSMDISQSLPAT